MSESNCDPFVFDSSCSFVDRVRAQLTITSGIEIARRYLAMNAFDGVLPVLGIIMGGFASLNFRTPLVIFETSILAIFATSFAMLISGITSSYLTESAERKRDVEELEKSMLSNLDGSIIVEANRTTTLVVSLINGLSPFVAGLGTAIPLFLVFIGLDVAFSFTLSVVFGMLILFGLGLFLGRVSRTNIIIYGLKTLLAGILVVIMIWIFTSITGY
jgi:predicted membrane protein (TIGR00267 family)